MKTGKIKSLVIMVKTVWATMYASFYIIYRSRIRRSCPRDLTDKIRINWAEKMLKYIHLDYEIFNPHQVKFHSNHNYIIMSNHESHYDIPLICMAIPGSVRMLCKKELFKIPFFGQAMRIAETPSIDRQNREQALKDLDYAKEKMCSGIRIWIAPEGTRSRNGKMGSFKKGGFMMALQTGATIIPVGIRGTYEILPPDTLDFTIERKAEVHIGKPISTAEFSLSDRGLLMQLVEKEIRRAAGQIEVYDG